eukprot:6177660-Pleurochrysis_carterae.AAC.1
MGRIGQQDRTQQDPNDREADSTDGEKRAVATNGNNMLKANGNGRGAEQVGPDVISLCSCGYLMSLKQCVRPVGNPALGRQVDCTTRRASDQLRTDHLRADSPAHRFICLPTEPVYQSPFEERNESPELSCAVQDNTRDAWRVE